MKRLPLFMAGVHYFFATGDCAFFSNHYDRATCHYLAACAWLIFRLVVHVMDKEEAAKEGK